MRELWLVAAALALTGCGGCSKGDANKNADAAAFVDAAADVVDAALAEDAAALDDAAMPSTQVTEDLQTRMRHLLEAMAQDNPDLAMDALFPRDGYVAARDVPDPQKAWDKKVSTSYRHAIERSHKRLKGVEHAKFVSFELGRSMSQITPKKKDFKKPLWRVKHSKLSFTIDGKPRHIDVAEMTAWRGAWYVTRLH